MARKIIIAHFPITPSLATIFPSFIRLKIFRPVPIFWGVGDIIEFQWPLPRANFDDLRYMNALLLSKSPPIASEDDLSDFDATEVGDDDEVGERIEMKHDDDEDNGGVEGMDYGTDSDLDSPIEEVTDHIKLYSFSGVHFRRGNLGKSQSDYEVLKRKSAPCDETVGNYNYWIQQGKKWNNR